MGGQLDIDIFEKCQLLKLDIPETVKEKYFLGPSLELMEIREYTKCHDKPLFGGIVKPKIGVTPEVLLEMVDRWLKEALTSSKKMKLWLILLSVRLKLGFLMIMNYLKDKNVVYAVCIKNSDPMHVIDRVKKVYELGGNAVHINFWSGLGVYKSIRELDLPLFVHFQKSGDKILTNKTTTLI